METCSLTLHESHSRNGQTVLDLRPRPLQFEGRDVDTLIRDAREIEQRLRRQVDTEEPTREDILAVATQAEAETLQTAWSVPYHSELRGRVVIDADVQATASGATDGLRQRLRKRTGISRETHYVWVDGAEKVRGRIELPSRYDKVFVATGNAADPEVTVLTGREAERPYYRIEGGKTVIYVDGFSGGGGANVWRVPDYQDDYRTKIQFVYDAHNVRLAGHYNLWADGVLRNHEHFEYFNTKIPPGGRRGPSGSFSFLSERGGFYVIDPGYDGRAISLIYDTVQATNRTTTSSSGRPNEAFQLYFVRDATEDEINTYSDGDLVDTYYGNDGKSYPAVFVNELIFTSEPSNETKYADGTDIPVIEDATDWENDTDGARCYYDNDEATYGSTYGSLYNWHAVDNAAGIVAPQEATVYVRMNGEKVPASVKVRVNGQAVEAGLYVQ